MARIAHRTAMRVTAALAAGALAVAGLAACTAPKQPQSTPSSHSSLATPSSSPTPTVKPTPSATPTTASGTPIQVSCSGLLSPQLVYDFNPNTSLQPAYKPKAGTDASVAVANNGLACGLVNDSSGAVTAISAAHPAASEWAKLKTAAAKGTPVSGLGDAAYFSTHGQNGELQVFKAPYWITASSVFFGTADDARQLMIGALSAVK